jgi:hypothetical protein
MWPGGGASPRPRRRGAPSCPDELGAASAAAAAAQDGDEVEPAERPRVVPEDEPLRGIEPLHERPRQPDDTERRLARALPPPDGRHVAVRRAEEVRGRDVREAVERAELQVADAAAAVQDLAARGGDGEVDNHPRERARRLCLLGRRRRLRPRLQGDAGRDSLGRQGRRACGGGRACVRLQGRHQRAHGEVEDRQPAMGDEPRAERPHDEAERKDRDLDAQPDVREPAGDGAEDEVVEDVVDDDDERREERERAHVPAVTAPRVGPPAGDLPPHRARRVRRRRADRVRRAHEPLARPHEAVLADIAQEHDAGRVADDEHAVRTARLPGRVSATPWTSMLAASATARPAPTLRNAHTAKACFQAVVRGTVSLSSTETEARMYAPNRPSWPRGVVQVNRLQGGLLVTFVDVLCACKCTASIKYCPATVGQTYPAN